MKNRYVVYAAVFLVLGALIYLQFSHLATFDWNAFLSQTPRPDKLQVLFGIGWIYLAYVMRAIRWNVFPPPSAPRSQPPAICTDHRGLYRPGTLRSEPAK